MTPWNLCHQHDLHTFVRWNLHDLHNLGHVRVHEHVRPRVDFIFYRGYIYTYEYTIPRCIGTIVILELQYCYTSIRDQSYTCDMTAQGGRRS